MGLFKDMRASYKEEKKLEEIGLKTENVSVLKRVCQKSPLDISLSKIEVAGLWFGKNEYGDDFKSEDDLSYKAYGVLYEFCRTSIFTPFEMNFYDTPLYDYKFGSILLSKTDERKRKDWHDMTVIIDIYDPKKEIRNCLTGCMKNAAISGNQFFNIRIIKDEMDLPEQLRKLSKDGYSDRVSIKGLRVWDEITLPKTPTYGAVD